MQKLMTIALILVFPFARADIPAEALPQASSPETPDWPDPLSRGAPTDLFDDFEAYAAGQGLAAQSDWFNVVDSGDTVLAVGLDGQSAAHVSDGSTVFDQVLGRETATGEYGTLSLDVEINDGESAFIIFPAAEADLLNTGIRFSDTNRILVFQDSQPNDGFLELVSTNSFWQPDVPMRVDFEVDQSGEVRIRVDGRVLLVGEDTAKVNNSGVSTPVNFIGLRASNSAVGDTIVIDNVSNLATTAQDAPGETDLYHAAGRGILNLGDSLADQASAYPGETFSLSTLTLNTSSSGSATDVHIELAIPPELDFVSAQCAGAFNSGIFVSEPFSIPADGSKVCSFDLRLNTTLAGAPEDFLVVETEAVSGGSADPYLPNNSTVFFVLEDPGIIFEDGFEPD